MPEPKEKLPSPIPQDPTLASRTLSEAAFNPVLAAKRLHELTVDAERAGRFEEALPLAYAHVEVARRVPGSAALMLALLSRARLNFKVEEFEQAVTDAHDVLRLTNRDRALPPPHAAHINYTASHLLGASLWRKGDLAAAERQLVTTTDFARTRFGTGSPEVIKSLFDQAFLATERQAKEATLISRVNEIIQEARTQSSHPASLATQALELGRALNHHGFWDAASYTLDWAAQISTCPTEKTEALLTIANIASYKSDTNALLHFVKQAEALWLDVAPRPNLERHIANLRAIAAFNDGKEDLYREQLALAQHREEGEELSVEERIRLHFARAEGLRHEGLEDEARGEVEDAYILAHRAIVSPLARFNTFLQQGFCEYTRGNFRDSTRLINEALIIVHHDLDRNRILEARARTLLAHNHYALYTYSEQKSPEAHANLMNALRDGELALTLLTQGELDPHSRKGILRLLSGVTCHLDLSWKQVQFDRDLALLEAKYPQTLL